MNAKKYAEQIRQTFQENGFPETTVLNAEYSWRFFGNATVTIEYQSLRFRVVKDRLQEFVSLQLPCRSEWWESEDVEVALGTATLDQLYEAPTFEVGPIVGRISAARMQLLAEASDPQSCGRLVEKIQRAMEHRSARNMAERS